MKYIFDSVLRCFCYPSRLSHRTSLEILGIGVGIVLFYMTLSLLPCVTELYSSAGLLQEAVLDALEPNRPISISLVQKILPFASPQSVAWALMGLLICSSIRMALGSSSVVTYCSAWFFHWCLKHLCSVTNYGVVEFVNIALFYLAVHSILRAFSSASAPVIVRVIQLHLCVVYSTSGYWKSQGYDWWTGDAIWKASNMEPLVAFPNQWLAWFPLFCQIGSIMVLVLEIGYGAAVWVSCLRRPWIAAVVLMHIGIALVMGLHTFSLVMILLNLCAFIVPQEAKRGNAITVAYDGHCRVCRRVIFPLVAISNRAVRPVGVYEGKSLKSWIPKQLDTILVKSSDGKVFSGGEAFVLLIAHSINIPMLGQLGRLPGIENAYRAFARNRKIFGCHKRCAI